ncbi:hypothetical protein FRC02_001334 [Tulasnella sp. 418]|nr:hypothetical protein FRC02_001334 [Tulasnella sp. 418]
MSTCAQGKWAEAISSPGPRQVHSGETGNPSSSNHEDIMSELPERHPQFYSSGLMVLQIENTLYRTDINLLKHFQVFQDMFEHAVKFNPGQDEGQVDSYPIRLQGVTAFEFESLLQLHNLSSIFDEPGDVSCKHWGAVLRLATMWIWDELRARAIREIERLKPCAALSIHLAQNCDVPHWLEPAYIDLCLRSEPITAEEGTLIGIQTLTTICQIREKVVSAKCGAGEITCITCGAIVTIGKCRSCFHACTKHRVCMRCSSPLTNREAEVIAEVRKHFEEAMISGSSR